MVVLKVFFFYYFVGASLCRLCLSSVFGAWAGFDGDASHVFSQGVLAPITFIGGVVSVGELKICSGCEVGHPLCSVAVPTLLGSMFAPQLLEWRP